MLKILYILNENALPKTSYENMGIEHLENICIT